MKLIPRIRTGLLRHRLEDQVLVYDSRDDRVHLLDPSTGHVLDLLERGTRTREEIAAELSRLTKVEQGEALLALSLDELRKADMLDKEIAPVSRLAEVSRRELVRKIGLAGATALLIPAIATFTASSAYAQGSLLADCQPCTDKSQCVSNQCKANGGTLCGTTNQVCP